MTDDYVTSVVVVVYRFGSVMFEGMNDAGFLIHMDDQYPG